VPVGSIGLNVGPGVPVHHLHYESYAHGFYSVPMLYPEMSQAWAELCTYVESVKPTSHEPSPA